MGSEEITINSENSDKFTRNKVFTTIGASNHSLTDRAELDFYATDPIAAKLLIEKSCIPTNTQLWECACGDGQLSKAFKSMGFEVVSSDIIDRGYSDFILHDFLNDDVCNINLKDEIAVVTNPPFESAEKFIRKAFEIKNVRYIAMFLKLTFLETKRRYQLFQDYKLKELIVSSSRIPCYRNGDRTAYQSAVAYGWYVFDKEYSGEPTIIWGNK